MDAWKMTAERAAIVRCAKMFLGAPFVHAGRTSRGVDCAGLVLLARRAATGAPGEFLSYGDPPTTRQIAEGIKRFLLPIPLAEAGPGDVAFLRYSGEPSHFGILTGDTVIHASPISGQVVETRTNNIAALYRIRGIKPWPA